MRYPLGAMLIGGACNPYDGGDYRWDGHEERVYRHWLHEQNKHHRQFNSPDANA